MSENSSSGLGNFWNSRYNQFVMFSKLFILIVVVLSLVLILSPVTSHAIKSFIEISQIFRNCADKSGTSEADIQDPLVLFTSDAKNILEMDRCLLEELEIVDSHKKVSRETVAAYLKVFPKEMLDEVLKCVDQVEKIEKRQDLDKFRSCLVPIIKKFM